MFNLQLKLKNPLSSILFHPHYRYTTINKITWCIFNLIRTINQAWNSEKQPDTKQPRCTPPKYNSKWEKVTTHLTAVAGKNHFLCYKAWQLLPTYSLFCCEGRMSQTRPVQLPVPNAYHLICHVLSFCISTTVASAACCISQHCNRHE